MKICSKCKAEKDHSLFHKNRRQSDGLQSYCKSCAQITNADTYRRLPKRRLKIKERNQQSLLYCRRLIAKLKKMKGCLICQENEPCALDFHHVNPAEKDTEISLLNKHSVKKVKAEIRKCVILCSNCHRKHHAGIDGYSILPNSSLPE